MSSEGKDPDKRHRHDVGEVAHGATNQEAITTAIQYTLALCVIGTAALIIYAMSMSGSAGL